MTQDAESGDVCLHPLNEHTWLSDDVYMCCACGQKFIAIDPALIDGSFHPTDEDLEIP